VTVFLVCSRPLPAVTALAAPQRTAIEVSWFGVERGQDVAERVVRRGATLERTEAASEKPPSR
jgi:hypothetical protein